MGIFFIILSCFLTTAVWAQSSLRLKDWRPSMAPRSDQFNVDVQLSQSLFFNQSEPGFSSSGSDQISEIGLRSDGSWAGLQFDLEGLYRGGENAGYLKPYELFRTESALGIDWSLGRRKFDWSSTDEFWRQGLFQSRFTEEKWMPESAGLVGLFAAKKLQSGFELRLGFLPLFIPEIGPQFRAQNGSVRSSNPWFRSPPANLTIEEIETPVNYQVSLPELNQVINNPGGIASVGWRNELTQLKVTYAYKPMPQLIFGFPFGLELAEAQEDVFLAIDVRVRTLYHHLSHVEWQQQMYGLRFINSLSFEAPGPDNTPTSWLSQAVSEAWIASSRLSVETVAGDFEVGSLQIWGGEALDRGDFRPESGSVFESRFQFRQAFRLGWTSPKWSSSGWLSGGGFWQTRSELTFDRLQQGLMWLNELRYQRPSYGFFGRLDVLGLTSENAAERSGFVANYRSNDRLQAGLHVFF